MKSIIITSLLILVSLSLVVTGHPAKAQDDKPLMPFAELVKEYVVNCNLGANFFTKIACHDTIQKLHDGDCKSSLSYITIEECHRIDQYLDDNPQSLHK
jgi:hypothetical protein